jgi:hypothetical protein
MRNILYKLAVIVLMSSFMACDNGDLFKTTEAPTPQVSDVDWTAASLGVTQEFAEGGRLFRLTNPIDVDNPYRDVQFSTVISSNDSRNITSIGVELQNIVAPYGAQGWAPYVTITIPPAEQAPTYEFTFDLNLDDWSTSYWGGPLVATGAFGIIREDNTMRYTVNFDDGSSVRLAQIQFSYALTEAGEE